MKLCSVVALFLIWVIPMKITHVYSQSELLWGAKGSGLLPKVSRLIPKMHGAEPSFNLTSDNLRTSTKRRFVRDVDLSHFIPYKDLNTSKLIRYGAKKTSESK